MDIINQVLSALSVLIPILVGVIAFLVKSVKSPIISQIEGIREDMEKITEGLDKDLQEKFNFISEGLAAHESRLDRKLTEITGRFQRVDHELTQLKLENSKDREQALQAFVDKGHYNSRVAMLSEKLDKLCHDSSQKHAEIIGKIASLRNER